MLLQQIDIKGSNVLLECFLVPFMTAESKVW